MSLYKYCECGTRFEASRESAKYCSVACSQRAYRERISIKNEQEAYQAAQNAILEEERSLLEQMKAESDRILAEERARQEIINEERRERELRATLEREQKLEKQRKLKVEQREKDRAATEFKSDLYKLGGLVVIGALNYIAKTMQQPQKPEIRPSTSNTDQELPV